MLPLTVDVVERTEDGPIFYEINHERGRRAWVARQRYSTLHAMATKLKDEKAELPGVSFPPKRLLTQLRYATRCKPAMTFAELEARRSGLQSYLSALSVLKESWNLDTVTDVLCCSENGVPATGFPSIEINADVYDSEEAKVMSRKFQLHSASATESANNFLRYLSISPVGEPDDEYTLGEAMVDSFACCTVFPTNASISSTKNGGGVATIAAALTAQEEARSNAPLSGSSDTLLAQQLTGKMLDATEAHPQLVDVPTLTPTSGLASVPQTEISAGAAVKQGDSDFVREHHGASAASQLGGPATLEAKECQDETNGCTRKGRKKSTALSTLKKLPSFVFRRGHNLFVGKKTGDKDAEVAADPGLKTTNLQSSSWATSARADPHRTTSLRAHHWSRSTMGRLSTFCDSGRSSKSLPPGGGDKCGPSNSPGSKRKSFFSKTKFGSKRNLPPSTGFSKDIIYTKKNGATSFFPESP